MAQGCEPLGITAVAQGVPGFTKSLQAMDTAIDTVGESAVEMGKQVEKTGAVVSKAVTGLAVIAVGSFAAVGTSLFKLALDTAPLQATTKTFTDMAKAAGTAGDKVLAGMKKASFGVLSNREAMQLWNSAAIKVGNTFAKNLPKQIAVLTKASIRTGQDLTKVVETYTKGIADLSEAQLESLGISLDFEKIYERQAKKLGIEVKELTEAQKRSAVLAATNRALAITYKKAGDGAELNILAMKSLSATITDFKDELGLALQPALARLIATFKPIIELVLPALVELFRDRIVPAVERLIGWFAKLVEAAMEFGPVSKNFLLYLISMFPRDVQQRIIDWINTLYTWFFRLRKIVIENKDAIIGAIQAIGAALAASAIFRQVKLIIAIFTGINPVLAAMALAVALLGAAWKTDFLGMRTTIETFWKRYGEPIFNSIREWFEEKIPMAIDTLKRIWNENVLPLFTIIRDFAVPIIERAVDDFLVIFNWLKDKVKIVWDGIWEIIGETVTKIRNTITEGIEEGKTPFEIIGDVIEELFGERAGNFVRAFFRLFSAVFGQIKRVFDRVWGVIITGMEEGKGPVDILSEVIGELFGDRVRLLFEKARDIIAEVIDVIRAFITGDVETLEQTPIGRFLLFVRETAQKVVDFVTEMVNNIASVIEGDGEGIDFKALFGEDIGGFIETIIGYIDEIKSRLELFFDEARFGEGLDFTILFGEDIGGTINDIIEDVGRIVTWFQENWPLIQEEIDKIVVFIRDTFGPTFAQVSENVGAIIDSLVELFGDELSDVGGFLDNVVTWWEEHGAQVIAIVGGLVRLVLAVIQNFILLVTTVIRVGLAILRGDWEEAWTAIKDFLSVFVDNALAVVGQTKDDLIESWTGIWDNILLIVETIGIRIGDAIKNFIGGITDTISEWIDSIWTMFSDFSNAIGDFVYDTFNDAVAGIKDILGLASPSKVFEGIGENIVAGLEKGMASMQPSLQLSQPVASPAGATTTNNFEMNITSSAPTEQVAQDFQMMEAIAARRS